MTRERVLGLLIPATLLVAAPVAAQEDVSPQERDCVCIEDLAGHTGRAVSMLQPRARLGVMLGEVTREGGRNGVVLEEVTEGSPAMRAGLRDGDIVVAIDGDPLGEEAGEDVVEHMGGVEPGDTVEVTYLRDGAERTARVVTEEGGGFAFLRGPGELNVERMAPRAFRFDLGEGPAGAWVFRTRSHGLELAEVNPELGRYFGTDHGLLVVEVDEDSPLGLRAGDVILSVDGRDVRDAGHARSIISSYRDDEPITFRVVRDQREQDVRGSAR
jgi:predicted metalloprotease with PDZ domain